MVAEGLITEAQAAMLHESVGKSAGGKAERTWPFDPAVVAVILVLIGVAAGAFWIATGGGEPTAIQDVSETINQPGEHGEMNRSISWLLGIALLLVLPLLIWVWLHNSLVSREEQVFNNWAQVESNFQRRNDLVPALVEVVNRYLKHERETLSDVTSKRAEAANQMAAAVDRLIEAQGATGELLSRESKGLIENGEAFQELVRSQRGADGQHRPDRRHCGELP
ncbi:LemA family protein [Roseibium salinum]|nr:LemA family protein [Roseibium salinum]